MAPTTPIRSNQSSSSSLFSRKVGIASSRNTKKGVVDCSQSRSSSYYDYSKQRQSEISPCWEQQQRSDRHESNKLERYHPHIDIAINGHYPRTGYYEQHSYQQQQQQQQQQHAPNSYFPDDHPVVWTKQDQQQYTTSQGCSEHHNNGWYHEYSSPTSFPRYQAPSSFQQHQQHQQDIDQQHPIYSLDDHRHSMCPSPPPAPPSHSDYYQEISRHGASPYPSDHMVSRHHVQHDGGDYYHCPCTMVYNDRKRGDDQGQYYRHHKENGKEPTTPLPIIRRHSETTGEKAIHEVTPLSSDTVERKSFVLEKDVFSNLLSSKKTLGTPSTFAGGVSNQASTFTASTPFGTLQDMDIVCGRGAPTNYHIGNEMFRGLVSTYHTSYFCAKRSEKPNIAMKVLDVLQSRGARFVRRQKGVRFPVTSKNTKNTKDDEGELPLSSSYWMEVSHKLAYEKVCQALRNGAPNVQRHILSSTRIIQQESSDLSSNTTNTHSTIEAKDAPFVEQHGKENGCVNKE